ERRDQLQQLDELLGGQVERDVAGPVVGVRFHLPSAQREHDQRLVVKALDAPVRAISPRVWKPANGAPPARSAMRELSSRIPSSPRTARQPMQLNASIPIGGRPSSPSRADRQAASTASRMDPALPWVAHSSAPCTISVPPPMDRPV